jgi:hypothetical protein
VIEALFAGIDLHSNNVVIGIHANWLTTTPITTAMNAMTTIMFDAKWPQKRTERADPILRAQLLESWSEKAKATLPAR